MSDFKSVQQEPWNSEEEERHALRMLPFAKDIADYVKSKIPPDTDFGVLIFAKPLPGKKEGRVIAITSDRQRVAFYAAQWALSVKAPDDPSAKINVNMSVTCRECREVFPSPEELMRHLRDTLHEQL